MSEKAACDYLVYDVVLYFYSQRNDKKKKVKYNYKTVDELIATGGSTKRKGQIAIQSELAKVKVIDMTGREQRVLSGEFVVNCLQ